jgi:hypothetical protein
MPNDDAELVKAGMEGAVEGAMKPFGDLLHALFGPAAAEAGLMFKESLQHYRHQRRRRLFKRTQEVLASAGIEPARVPLKLLLPIIENASNEHEDTLQDIWANLLANAATQDATNKVYPSFPAILRELTARDVKFLDALFAAALKLSKGTHRTGSAEEVTFIPKMLSAIYSQAGLARHMTDGSITAREWKLAAVQADARDMRLSLDTFERHGVVVKVYKAIERDQHDGMEIGIARSFTSLGACFVAACRDPKDTR